MYRNLSLLHKARHSVEGGPLSYTPHSFVCTLICSFKNFDKSSESAYHTQVIFVAFDCIVDLYSLARHVIVKHVLLGNFVVSLCPGRLMLSSFLAVFIFHSEVITNSWPKNFALYLFHHCFVAMMSKVQRRQHFCSQQFRN